MTWDRGPGVAAVLLVQASSSQARAVISHHSWFWAKSLRGRLAPRIRSSRARRRCGRFRSVSWAALGIGGEGGEPVPAGVACG
jgi:hypothetical protein